MNLSTIAIPLTAYTFWLLAELERIVGKIIEEIRRIWNATIPKIFAIAKKETNQSIQALLDHTSSGCSDGKIY